MAAPNRSWRRRSRASGTRCSSSARCCRTTPRAAACRRRASAACKRLKTDRIDLYLLHWRGGHPLAETVAAFDALRPAGKIRYWGVSNLDADDMEELVGRARRRAPARPIRCCIIRTAGASNIDLLPWCAERGIPVMAYSPLGHDVRPAAAAPRRWRRWRSAMARRRLRWRLPGDCAVGT